MQLWVFPGLIALFVGCGFGWWLGRTGERSRVAAAEADSRGKDTLVAELRSQLDQTGVLLGKEQTGHNDARARLHTFQAQLEAERSANAEKIAILQGMEDRLKREFESLAASALATNANRLLELHRNELTMQRDAAAKDLGTRESAISKMLEPMGEQLQRLAAHSQNLEVKREGAYQAMLKEMESMRLSHADLRRETAQLVQALRAPKARGNWGEMQLRRCVEYAGMLEHASFEVERTVRGEDSSVRPDLIIRLPNHRCVIVDAKTPLDSFLNASGCEDESVRQRFLAEHAAAVRGHLNALAGKAYWSRLTESPDFVVCFLPSEVLFSAALEQDPSLLEHSAGGKVLLATPTTLIALLKAVAYGWQQAEIARDAQLIRDVAGKVHAKLAAMHTCFLNLGNHLRKAGECYDDALVKADGRGGLFSIARQLRDFKIGEKDLSDSKPVAFRPRSLDHEDWQNVLSLAAVAADDADRN